MTSETRSLSLGSSTTSFHRVPSANQLCVYNRAVCVVSCSCALQIDTVRDVSTRLDSIRRFRLELPRDQPIAESTQSCVAFCTIHGTEGMREMRERKTDVEEREGVTKTDVTYIRAKSERRTLTAPPLTRFASCRISVSRGMTRISSDDECFVEVTTCTRNRNATASRHRVSRNGVL